VNLRFLKNNLGPPQKNWMGGRVDVVKKTSGKGGNNNDDGRERHIGGWQQLLANQRQRLERGWQQHYFNLNKNPDYLSYRLHDGGIWWMK